MFISYLKMIPACRSGAVNIKVNRFVKMFAVTIWFWSLAPPVMAAEETAWSLLVGGGTSHPGWGKTEEKVETVDLLLRYTKINPQIRGKDWYRHQRNLLIEIPVHFLTSPSEPPMFGLYFSGQLLFRPGADLQPYLFAGGGPVYTEASIPGTSSNLKGAYQAGVGFKFPVGDARWSLEYRYHHVSNGGIEKPNDPLNSSKVLLGYKLPF